MAAFDPKNLHILIMAGGSGTRFWPKSRVAKPKQLLCLWDDKTLLEHTVERFSKKVPEENLWIVTTQSLIEPSQKVLAGKFPKVNYLGEPEGKNTAACVLWGTLEIHRKNPEAIVAVMSADSYIADNDAFFFGLERAVLTARDLDSWVTIGIKPDRPETGYGYIEIDKAVTDATRSTSLEVKKFVEKPTLREALRYVESRKYFWNAGMFIFKASAGLAAYRKTMPELTTLFESAKDIPSVYSQIRAEDATSIDYGVMEPSIAQGVRVYVVPVSCGWNDVGSFNALDDIGCGMRGNVVTFEANCNVVQCDSGLVALLGVSDLVVVKEGDIVLVASKDRTQDIKTLVAKVKKDYPDKV